MVLVVSLVALLVPNFADFLSLVGSSVCVVLSFVLPAMFHCLVFKEELGWSCMITDGAIVVFGFIVAVSGTWSSLQEILATKAWVSKRIPWLSIKVDAVLSILFDEVEVSDGAVVVMDQLLQMELLAAPQASLSRQPMI